MQAISDDTVHRITVLYKKQSIVSNPTLDPLPPSPDNNSSHHPSPSSSSSYHQAPASFPPSPPLGTFCSRCSCNLEHGEFCRHHNQTFYCSEGERIIVLQNISLGTRHSPQCSIPHSTSLPSLPPPVSPPGLIQDPNIIRNLPQDYDPEVDDHPPLSFYSASTLPAYYGRHSNCLHFQKDNFSHANLTIPNSDVHVILNNNTPRTHPHYKVAIFQDQLESMWDFHPHLVIVEEEDPNAEVTTDRMVKMPNLIQQTGYPTLSTEQALVSNHMVIPFSIQPCETLNQEGRDINSFLFQGESIASGNETAGFAFPTEKYEETPNIPVHYQGFEILHRFHLPPSIQNQTFWKYFHPNLCAEENGLDFAMNAPSQRKWNKDFVNFFRNQLHGCTQTNSFFL